MAAVAASKEAVHLKLLLGELGVNHEKLIIEEDNTACISQVKGGLRFIRKAKHYQVALRFIQKLQVDGEVDFNYCQTDEQIADLFTKALAEPKFIHFRDKVMYCPPEITVENTEEVQETKQNMKVLDTASTDEVD